MYAERVELGHGVHELAQGPCETVVALNEDGVESASLGIREQTIERFLVIHRGATQQGKTSGAQRRCGPLPFRG
jgi:hypothetical protein